MEWTTGMVEWTAGIVDSVASFSNHEVISIMYI